MQLIVNYPHDFPKNPTELEVQNVQPFASILDTIGIDHIGIYNEGDVYARIMLYEKIYGPFLGKADENGATEPMPFTPEMIIHLRGLTIRCQLMSDRQFITTITDKPMAYWKRVIVEIRKGLQHANQ